MGTPSPPIEVVATPRERFVLFEVLFQRDETGGNRVLLANGAEGRLFRGLLAALGLRPIRQAMARFGHVSPSLLASERWALFHVPPDVVRFYREHLADLPRGAAQEAVAGEFLDSLNAIEPGPYHRCSDAPVIGARPWNAAEEVWAPDEDRPVEGFTVSALRVREALEAFEDATEGLAMPAALEEALARFQDAIASEVQEPAALIGPRGG
jgi:hypothetical protein